MRLPTAKSAIQAAHTFLTLDPSLSLLVVEDKATIGGTWAASHIYPNLRTCNLQGFLQWTDFDMLDADVGVKPRDIIHGKAVYEYFEHFVEKFDLKSHIKLKTKVVKATNNAEDDVKAWTVELRDVDDDTAESFTITCSKLLVCTGQTSQPNIPSHRGAETFGKPIVHSQNIAAHHNAIRQNPDVEHVTIIGGGKSAHDAVYNHATAGKRVTWVVRNSKSGKRPWMSSPFPAIGPLNPWLEGLLMTRPLSWMGAAPFADGDGFGWIRSCLHGTAVGRFIVRTYFGQMSADTVKLNGLTKLGPAGDALKPLATLQWYGGQAGILNYDQQELDHLEPGLVILADGRKIRADAIINATGYKFCTSFPIYPLEKQISFGMPVPPEQDDIFPVLENKADQELPHRFPELHNSPAVHDKTASLTPCRLWRFIAPPSQAAQTNGPRNLAFLTNIETYQTFLRSELVALWTYAYMNNQLEVSPQNEDVFYNATLYSRFGWWQKPLGKQGKSGDCFHEGMAFYDRLMLDLGLNSWRKGWGLLGEVFGGHYNLSDYQGVKQEWVAKRASLGEDVRMKIRGRY